jgi:hypothetical protein
MKNYYFPILSLVIWFILWVILYCILPIFIFRLLTYLFVLVNTLILICFYFLNKQKI